MRAFDARDHAYAIIMAGGGGERFWPRSRRAQPKQLHRLFGGRTMIQETVSRISALVPRDRIIVVTTAAQAPLIRKQLPGVARGSVIAEPFGRDTAACIALGAAVVMERDPEGIMVVLPADHVIRARRKLIANLRDACRVASEHGCLVTLGITPTEPSTGFGYIRRGRALDVGLRTAFFTVEQFMEKPNAATARGYCRSGEYFWNSGMFIWRASVIVREFKKHMPRHYRGYLRIKKALGKPSSGGVIKKVYAGLTAISIDYGIMEKADSVVVARADFDWDDAGSWLALERHFATDASGNVVLGEGLALDAERCIIVSDEGMVACHGVKDLIIVRTPDAVLVCHRDAAQDMKKITKRLRERQRWTRYT